MIEAIDNEYHCFVQMGSMEMNKNFFILGVFFVLFFQNPSVAVENDSDSSLVKKNAILHKTERLNFYFGGHAGSMLFPGRTLGAGILGGINAYIFAIEANFQHWDELPNNILSGTAFLNFPSRSSQVGPYILFGLGLMSDNVKYITFGLGSEFSTKSSFAFRPELKLSAISDAEGALGWTEFRLNFLWNLKRQK